MDLGICNNQIFPVRKFIVMLQYFFNTQGWLRKCSSNEARVLRMLFDKIYGDAHTFVQTKLQTKMMLLEALYIRQCIDLLEGLNVGNSDPTSKYENFSFTNIYIFTHSTCNVTNSKHFVRTYLFYHFPYLSFFQIFL